MTLRSYLMHVHYFLGLYSFSKFVKYVKYFVGQYDFPTKYRQARNSNKKLAEWLQLENRFILVIISYSDFKVGLEWLFG